MLPKRLCRNCYISLETCFKFKIQCEESDKKFRKELLEKANYSFLPEVVDKSKTDATEVFEFIQVESAEMNDVHLEIENKKPDPIDCSEIEYKNLELKKLNDTNGGILQNINFPVKHFVSML